MLKNRAQFPAALAFLLLSLSLSLFLGGGLAACGDGGSEAATTSMTTGSGGAGGGEGGSGGGDGGAGGSGAGGSGGELIQFPAQIDDAELRMWINRLERRDIPRVTSLTYAEVTPDTVKLRDYPTGSS